LDEDSTKQKIEESSSTNGISRASPQKNTLENASWGLANKPVVELGKKEVLDLIREHVRFEPVKLPY
jgi:hypothetical protein